MGFIKKRTEALHFVEYTNLSHDHLDYHPTLQYSRDVKKSFFDNLPKDAFVLTNVDDKTVQCYKIQ
jgi:UDP-N-acetylmuramoyl-L-alanyl-D-glutamate--2,6-diaminopimelate ligase